MAHPEDLDVGSMRPTQRGTAELIPFRIVFDWGFRPIAAAYRLRVVGREHLPKTGGLVVSANQLSNVDSWLVAAAVRPRPVHYMGKAELFRGPIGALARSLGVFPVRRGQIDREALGEAVRHAGDGEVVGIFIEGTRRRKGFRKRHVARPHDGPAWVALRAGVPLIPIAIQGSDRLLRFRRLVVTIGAPVDCADLAELPAREARRALTSRLWHAIAAL
jgi:1-acyl-sn-glycerol-3-phosphate acyltransferase